MAGIDLNLGHQKLSAGLARREERDLDVSGRFRDWHLATGGDGGNRTLAAFAPTANMAFAAAPDIGYTFDVDAQGWTTVYNASFAHSPSDGNPGGYISGTDAGTGNWAFNGPAALLGDREGYYGGALSFDLWRSTGSGTVAGNDVVFEGGGIVLVIDLPVFAANGWTSFEFAIDIGTFHLNSPTGSIATEEQIRTVFADLDRVEIRGDYTSGTDTTRLDNFLIVEGTPAPPPGPGAVVTSTFDVDRDGWAFQADVREFYWVGTGGNPGGYLEAVDQTTGAFWYFVAPEKFVGDKSAFYGGSLAFDLNCTPGSINASDIILEGGGLTLVYNTPNNPGPSWTGYGIALDDVAGWRVDTITGDLATEAQMRAVLGDLDRLLIRGEFASGADTGRIDNVVMTAGGELFDGTAAGELLVGGTGYDTLNGLGGSDTLQGNGAGDTLDGGGGSDWADYSSAASLVRADLQISSTNSGDALGDVYIRVENLRGSAGNDVLFGNRKDNRLEGLDGSDVLNGRKGDDTLAGGAGKDRLTGSAGADRFELASVASSDADKILDFAGGADVIALDSDVFGLPEGALAPGRFAIGSAAGQSNDRLIYNPANGKLFFDPDGTGGQAQVLIATLTGAPPLSAGDFTVI